jgi:hypothetical protein
VVLSKNQMVMKRDDGKWVWEPFFKDINPEDGN